MGSTASRSRFDMKLGTFEIQPLTDGTFRLDGGAMFGVVPKVLWEKHHPADDRNRIHLELGVLLIRAHGMNIVVDTGIGNKGDEKFNEIYAVNRTPSIEASLAKHGLAPTDIALVINTHFHFDHAGGNTRRDDHGHIHPTFPRATYFIQKGEWEFANTPNERTRGSYLLENYEVLPKEGRLDLLEGNSEILKGVSVVRTPGHTEHHQSILVESNGEKALFIGDLIPTAAHLPLPYIMGYDLFPLTTMETKRELLAQAHEEHWLLIFQHDPKIRMGYLKKKEGRYQLEEVRVA
ncbi:MAG: MBL fold metallo-hydrolase [Candidatus Manganitrophus sp.]|nr:MBL fold metallo-hydrolase [Candidatus Manganitrophus sp.]WDT70792.1 MAG: MBL fold metallo-hydrolase [Candidatus Manganitrophus sp.]